MRYADVSRRYERKETPDAERDLTSLRICGTLTMEEAAMIPTPSPFEMASFKQAVSARSTSRRRVL